jgi:large subunit ribosomal protein L21
MSYAIIKVGGKQYKVQEGQSLLVDRLKADEGATFTPDLLFVPDGDGGSVTVTARVVGHEQGEKIRIGKYRRRTGYKRHTGFRASLTRIAIESIGAGTARTKAKAKPAPAPVEETSAEETTPLPAGYKDMTVADIDAAVGDWDRRELDAALAYEREHAARKGAIAALESAIGTSGEEA